MGIDFEHAIRTDLLPVDATLQHGAGQVIPPPEGAAVESHKATSAAQVDNGPHPNRDQEQLTQFDRPHDERTSFLSLTGADAIGKPSGWPGGGNRGLADSWVG